MRSERVDFEMALQPPGLVLLERQDLGSHGMALVVAGKKQQTEFLSP